MLKHAQSGSSSQIHLSVDAILKEDAEGLLKQMGLSMSEAVRLFLRQVVVEQAMPFSVQYSTNIPNHETQRAILDAREGKVTKTSLSKLRKMWDEA